ncbi:hypothetical protein JOE09_000003 [Pantoea coffeiphila]|nr:hypothetical protein [Pantoea coffeiphila]
MVVVVVVPVFDPSPPPAVATNTPAKAATAPTPSASVAPFETPAAPAPAASPSPGAAYAPAVSEDINTNNAIFAFIGLPHFISNISPNNFIQESAYSLYHKRQCCHEILILKRLLLIIKSKFIKNIILTVRGLSKILKK